MRLGLLKYRHSLPFHANYPQATIVMGTPKELTEKMKKNELDLAFLPVVVETIFPLRPVGDLGIACRGAVKSVALFCRNFPPKTYWITPETLTARALFRWLLKKAPWKANPIKDREIAESLLFIGDEALDAYDKPWKKIVDLSSWWYEETKLPFVFARLYGRLNPHPEEAPIVNALRENWQLFFTQNVNHYPQWQDYLKRFIYLLGEKEKEGLRKFLAIVRGTRETDG